MSAGAQENLPTAGSGTTTPRIPPGTVGEMLTRARGGGNGPRLGRVKTGLFVVLLTFISVIAIYPFLWLISASFKPQGEVFDNKLIPDTWQWNFTGDPTPVAGDERLFDLPDLEHGA